MPLPAVLATIATSTAAAIIAQIVTKLLQGIVWAGCAWMLWYSDFGLQLLSDWVLEYGWDVEYLALPGFMDGWQVPIAAADAWVPIAETWVLFKLYWTFFVSQMFFKMTWKVVSVGRGG